MGICSSHDCPDSRFHFGASRHVNDEGSYSTCRSFAQRCFEEAVADQVLSRKERACYQLANELKEMVEDGNPLASEASVYSDLLNASISEVNWKEIANNLLGEVEE
jgi:hypothetical protein